MNEERDMDKDRKHATLAGNASYRLWEQATVSCPRCGRPGATPAGKGRLRHLRSGPVTPAREHLWCDKCGHDWIDLDAARVSAAERAWGEILGPVIFPSARA